MSKTIVAIIVYNRFDNLKLWLECWGKCDKENADLIVIHNVDNRSEIGDYYELCHKHFVSYFSRQNEGMDIGAFKYFCEDRLFFPEYDNVIWITDDTIPMSKDFVKQFTSKLSDTVGLSCMEIANFKAPLHVRTTGFCISKYVAEKLTFPDQIVTKEDCYQFEHRGGKATLMKQVEAMGLKCVMVSDLKTSPLWDTGNRAHLKRMAEHKKAFSTVKDKVVFICPVYNSYPEIISSLICQTHKNWELRLIHDGPNTTGLADMIKQVNDPRIVYTETPKHMGNWGHYIRKQGLIDLKDSDADYVVITNADNYHVPTYAEYMVNGFTNNHVVATYCTSMVHSYINWGVIKCRLQRGYIDSAGVMVRAAVANDIGWRDIESHSSDWTYFEDIIKKHGVKSFYPVNGCLLIHN